MIRLFKALPKRIIGDCEFRVGDMRPDAPFWTNNTQIFKAEFREAYSAETRTTAQNRVEALEELHRQLNTALWHGKKWTERRAGDITRMTSGVLEIAKECEHAVDFEDLYVAVLRPLTLNEITFPLSNGPRRFQYLLECGLGWSFKETP